MHYQPKMRQMIGIEFLLFTSEVLFLELENKTKDVVKKVFSVVGMFLVFVDMTDLFFKFIV